MILGDIKAQVVGPTEIGTNTKAALFNAKHKITYFNSGQVSMSLHLKLGKVDFAPYYLLKLDKFSKTFDTSEEN